MLRSIVISFAGILAISVTGCASSEKAEFSDEFAAMSRWVGLKVAYDGQQGMAYAPGMAPETLKSARGKMVAQNRSEEAIVVIWSQAIQPIQHLLNGEGAFFRSSKIEGYLNHSQITRQARRVSGSRDSLGRTWVLISYPVDHVWNQLEQNLITELESLRRSGEQEVGSGFAIELRKALDQGMRVWRDLPPPPRN